MRIIKTYPKFLTKQVRFFYSIEAESFSDFNTTHHRLPDGTLDLVFNLGGPVSLSRDGVLFDEMPRIALTGLYPDRCFLRYHKTIHLVGVVFQPGFAHLFMNDGLANQNCFTEDASYVFGNDVSRLRESLSDSHSAGGRHDVIENYLFNFLEKKKKLTYHCLVQSAINIIHSKQGHIEVQTLWKQQSMSERTFRRQFHEFVGIAPKQYAAIIRVKSYGKRYESASKRPSELLDELGYTDQSHLNKEFQKIAGLSPTQYFGSLNQIGTEFIHLI